MLYYFITIKIFIKSILEYKNIQLNLNLKKIKNKIIKIKNKEQNKNKEKIKKLTYII